MSLYKYLKDNATRIHYWGLGFIQVRVGENVNYHFYSESIAPNFDTENPHNHAREFRSEILAGCLEEKRYHLTEGGSYEMRDNLCTTDDGIVPEKLYGVGCVEHNFYEKGDKYVCDKDTFHTVSATDCITKITKYGDRGEVFSLKLNEAPKGVITRYSEDILWKIVKEMCDKHEL